jgi:hypothetical protein
VERPQAEILFEPFRNEAEINALKRRFKRDLDLPVLDLQLDQLQPNRALAYGYKVLRAHRRRGAERRPRSGIEQSGAAQARSCRLAGVLGIVDLRTGWAPLLSSSE